ncbi:MAG: GlcG/HbpS family heme-binding protein [Cytophagaceae bacterium]
MQVLNYKTASGIINTIISELEKRNKQAIVAVTDAHGELIAFMRMENTKFPSINIAINKAYTAARSQRATSELGKASRDSEKGYDLSFYGDSRFTGFGGGYPIKQKDKVVGGVGVSGLSQEEDEELAILGVKFFIGD